MANAKELAERARMFEERAEKATDPISRQHYREMAAHYRSLSVRTSGRGPLDRAGPKLADSPCTTLGRPLVRVGLPRTMLKAARVRLNRVARRCVRSAMRDATGMHPDLSLVRSSVRRDDADRRLRFFYDCKGCAMRLKPLAGDCCVFCSYGSVPCPPVQSNDSCCVPRAAQA